MNLRDAIGLALAGAGTVAGVIGAGLAFGPPAAWIVLAALLLVFGFLFLSTKAETATGPTRPSEAPIDGEAPEVAHVRQRSRMALVRRSDVPVPDEETG